MINSVISLDHVVKSYLNETGVGYSSQFNQYKQIVIEGFTDLNISTTIQIQMFTGQVNEINRIALPPDFIDWISVSVEVNGEYYTLDENTNLVVSKSNNCGSITDYPEHETPVITTGLKFGRRPRNPLGEFNVDKTDKVIGFKGNFMGRTVYIEYVSPGVNESGDTWVPRELLTVLKRYLDFILFQNNDEATEDEISRKEYLLGLAMQQYENFKNSISPEDIYYGINIGLSQAIKR